MRPCIYKQIVSEFVTRTNEKTDPKLSGEFADLQEIDDVH